MNGCESFHPHLSKYLYYLHHYINLFLIKLTEYQNMIYTNFRTVNLPATVTSRWMTDGLIKNVKEEKSVGCSLFPRLVSFTKKNGISAVFPLNYSAAQQVKCSRAHWIVAGQLEFSFENAAGNWDFPCCIEFYSTIQIINNLRPNKQTNKQLAPDCSCCSYFSIAVNEGYSGLINSAGCTVRVT
jgi:hypothetical protein